MTTTQGLTKLTAMLTLFWMNLCSTAFLSNEARYQLRRLCIRGCPGQVTGDLSVSF